MKKILLTALLMSSFSCAVIAQGVTTGSDRDQHGCIGSAGYTWSAIKQDCIRIFEEPIQLKEANPKESYETVAALIFNKDKKKVEVFLPQHKEGVILIRSGKAGNYTWKKGDIVLTNKGGYKLKRAGKVIYVGMDKRK
jgi:hypothetical protein